MYQSNTIVFNPLTSITSSTVTSSYQLLGVIPYPARLLKILNNSSEDVTVSDDGTTDKDYVPAGSFVLYDFGANKGTSANALDLPAKAMYVKGTAGTGSVYLISLSALSPPFSIPGV